MRELTSLVEVVEKRGVSLLDLFGKYQIITREYGEVGLGSLGEKRLKSCVFRLLESHKLEEDEA